MMPVCLYVAGWKGLCVRNLLLMLCLLCGFTMCGHAQGTPDAKPAAAAPAQPIPFDHKLHAQTAKMTCNDCHAPRGDGTTVAMPQAPKCMTCHASVDADKPDIQRIAAAAKNEEPIEWVRVYRVPGFVTFSHKTHVGSECQECHGPVAERSAIALEKDTHMGTCIACHAAKQAATGCDTCHAIQSRNGHSPFDVDSTLLARLQNRPALPRNSPSAPGLLRASSFLHAPLLPESAHPFNTPLS